MDMARGGLGRDAAMPSVTSAEFVRGFGRWQDRVASSPVVVTHHGRDRMVMLSVDAYRTLSAERGPASPANDSDTRLDTLLERLAQGFLAFDAALCVTAMNGAAGGFLRAARGAAIGLRLEDVHPDMARSMVHAQLARAARTGEAATFDAPSIAYPGAWLRFQVFPYGEGAACLFHAIGDELALREHVRAGAARAAMMAAHGAIGQARLTPRATFAELDAAFAAMAGFEREALAQVRLTDILPIKWRVAAGEAIEAVLGGGETRAFDSALLVNKGGELAVRLALAPLEGEYGAAGATLVMTPR